MKHRIKLKYSYIICLFLIMLLSGCCEECCKENPICPECSSVCKPKKIENREYQEFNILLDLSNRLGDLNQKPRDIELLKGIYNRFTEVITTPGYNNSGLFKSNDILKITLASQISSDELKLKYEPLLSIDYSTIPIQDKASGKAKREKAYFETVYELYKEQIFAKGSDFGDFFFNLAKNNPSKNFDNKIIIISDGEVDNFKNQLPGKLDLSYYDIYFIEIDGYNGINDISIKESKIKNYLNGTEYRSLTMLNNKEQIDNILKIIFKKKVDDRYNSSNGTINEGVKKSTPKDSSVIIVDKYDCPDKKKNYGAPCSDGDPNTENDIIRDDCKCLGTKIKVQTFAWYSDEDGDGKGNPKRIERTVGPAPNDGGNWVKDSSDKCPNRSAKAIDGCPEFSIKVEETGYIGVALPVEAQSTGFLNNDKIIWSSSSLLFSPNTGLITSIKSDLVGKYLISFEVENPTSPILVKAQKEIFFKMTRQKFKEIIKPLLVQGSVTSGSGNFETASENALAKLNKHLDAEDIEAEDETGISYLGGLTSMLRNDLKNGKGKILDIEILDLGYSKSSGKINYVKYKLLRK